MSVPKNAPPQRCATREFLSRSNECGIENPHSFSSPCWRNDCGDFSFWNERPHSFPICGYSFQNGLGFQRDGSSFGSGFPIGTRAPCWLGNPKGTEYPWQWFPKAAALPWQEESNETGGFVAHDLARKV